MRVIFANQLDRVIGALDSEMPRQCFYIDPVLRLVNTTDPQLLTGSYPLLHDPEDIFGWGNVVPVASARAVDAEGPVFTATISLGSCRRTPKPCRVQNPTSWSTASRRGVAN